MTDSFYSEVTGNFSKPLPKDETFPKDIYGKKEIVNTTWYNFLTFFFVFSVICILITAGLFVYYFKEKDFKSQINNNIQPVTNVTTNNEYNLSTKNDFHNDFLLNATIIVNNLNIYSNHS